MKRVFLFWLALVSFGTTRAQTAFVDFNTPGQLNSRFRVWNDVGGTDAGNYSFQEGTNVGVGGSGGVSVFQSSDTTAIYQPNSWNFSTNGAVLVLSTIVKANGLVSGNKVQLGIINTNAGGLNNDAGIAFETFRFIPTGPTTWSLREQFRSGEALNETPLGTVSTIIGHWYKFEVALTNVSSASKTFDATCAIYDYGTNGIPGPGPVTNLVNFPTLRNNSGQTVASIPAVWPALRAFQSGGIDAWDNFTVYTPLSPPILTFPLTNAVVSAGAPVTFNVWADGPGPIRYAWYTNGILDAGVTGTSYLISALRHGFTNIAVVAANSNGAVSNSASVTAFEVTAPSVAVGAATGIDAKGATLHGTVVSTGGEAPLVTVYYGTTDGGTSAAAWEQQAQLGPETGSFTVPLTGLLSGTTYFYSAVAQNSGGTTWATPSLSFSTVPLVPATVTNLPVTNIRTDSAVLAGSVLSTGGQVPDVTLFYGTTDGGPNPTSWAASVDLGLQSGGFTLPIVGLISNTTYYATARVVNEGGTNWAVPSISFVTPLTNSIPPAVSVLTYHNNNARDGVNTNETQLTPANVGGGGFGKLFSQAVDGYVYAQPLIVPNVSIPGKGVHNVVYIATEHNSVYAFDADSADGANSAPLWQVSFLNPAAGVTTVGAGDVGTADIVPEVGITATPVIDPVTSTLYVEAKTKELTGGVTSFVHRLHALDLATGLEKTSGGVSNSPVIINVTNYPGTGTPGFGDNDGAGHVTFNTQREHSRPALTLVNGVIYIGFASHGDNQPYHGWLFAYDAHSLKQLSVYCSTPNGGLGGFWQGGGGATVDPDGNLYYETGNGSFDARGSTFDPARNSFAMSVLKFSTTNGVLRLTDFFSPHDEGPLSDADSDLGSGASLVLPDSVGTPAHPHLLVASGKGNRIYLLDRDQMGHFRASDDSQIVQTVPNAFDGGQNGSYMTPVYFNNTLYYIGMNDNLKAFSISNGVISTTPVVSSTFFGDKGSSSPSLSANGTSDAILWAIESDAYASSGPGILHAYNATNVAQELYRSSQNPDRDGPGGAVKFTVPTVANGKVYVGSQYQLSVFGLGTFLATPTITPPGGVFTNSVMVTISDQTPGTQIFYTLDGTIPTTQSLLYNGPFVLTNSTGVQAVAVKPGAVNSGVASAGFLNSSSIGTGTGLLGSYYGSHLPDNPFDGNPTLVRTDSTVDFDWGGGSPDLSIGADHFTVRWTGSVQPQFTETYTFATTTDDGVRLYVDGQLVIDQWVDQGPTTWTGTIPLVAGQRYDIAMEYYENGGGAVARLSWSSPSTPYAIIPTSQLYPITNPAPVVMLTQPTTNSAFAGTASITFTAQAAAQFNTLQEVDFYAGTNWVGSLTSAPYTLTVPGFAPGHYSLTAVAIDASGKSATSAPVQVSVTSGSGQPYGITSRTPFSAYGNMPPTPSGNLPGLLSQTGFFADTPQLVPANTLIPYAPNAPFWSDGAIKSRWMTVPNAGAPYARDEQIAFAPTGEWSFPAGTVFVKHFDLVTDYLHPNAPKRRLETRLLVRDPFGAVYGVTYKWRTDNSDADLLTNSLSENLVITNADATTRTQTWYYPSSAECLQCHTPVANYVLGANTRQLNGDLYYPSTGHTDNQLRALNRAGLFFPAINESAIAGWSHLESLTNASASLEDRARSWLDSNCSQCHQPGGTGPTFDARWDTPLAQQNLIDALPQKGTLGLDHARIVAPKDIWRSILYRRADTTNAAIQMPPLARNLIDTNSLLVVAGWIDSLAGTPALPPPTVSPNGGTFTGSVTVTLTPTDPTQSIYYTLDGSVPSNLSTLYTGPFQLTAGAMLQAKAYEAGFIDSAAAIAQFQISPGLALSPVGFLGNGSFALDVSGVVGLTTILEATTDFRHWVPLSTNTPTASPFRVIDPGASGFGNRYYRVVQP
jgi:uncharacterized repeat protein (TIGR03806 family)